jgi:hypothetical protein
LQCPVEHVELNCQLNKQPGEPIVFEATKSIFRQCLDEAIAETLENDPSQDRDELVRELAARWSFNVSDYLNEGAE